MILLLIIVQILIASEELNYNVKVNGINAGAAILKLENDKNNKSEITFSVRSNKLIDLFYKLRDDVTLIVHSKDFSIMSIDKSINQGRYKKNNSAIVDYTSNIIYSNNQEIQFKNKIYSPISIMYFLRNKNLSINKQFGFQIFDNNKIKNVFVEVIGNEIININDIEYDCHVLKAQLMKKNNLLKEIMTFYLSKDNNKIPVIIKSKIKPGKMVLTIQ